MRTASFYLNTAAIVGAYGFATLATDHVTADAALLERIFGPLRFANAASVLCLQFAIVAWVLGSIVCPRIGATGSQRLRPFEVRRLWRTAFTTNIVLVGVIAIVIAGIGAGWVERWSMSPGDIGSLAVLALLELSVGAGLAVFLASQPKPRSWYVTTVSLLVLEGGFLGTVILVGLRA